MNEKPPLRAQAMLAALLLLISVSSQIGFREAEAIRPGQPPEVDISFPANGSMYPCNSTVNLFVQSWDWDGFIQKYCWSVEKDGQPIAVEHPGGERFDAFLPEPGRYNVTVTAEDDDHLTATSGIWIDVVENLNEPPVAVIDDPVDNGTYFDDGGYMIFNATSSHDPDGTIVGYYWNFKGGQSSSPMHISAPGPIFQQIDMGQNEVEFPKAGRYEIFLTVEDNEGLRNSTSATINIAYGHNNTPPVPVIGYPPDRRTFPVNSTINFSSEGSFDPDGVIVERRWNIESARYTEPFRDKNGTVHGAYPNHTFSKEGFYEVFLIVRDDGGKERHAFIVVDIWGDSSRDVNISSPANDSTVFAGDEVAFFANGTDDGGQRSIYLEWDFGDGSAVSSGNWWEGAGPAARHTYSLPGRYTVTLTAGYADGSNGSVTARIQVLARPALNATISSPAAGQVFLVDESIAFSARARYGEQDPDCIFRWDFGDGSSGEGSNTTNQYRSAGNYTIVLTTSYADLTTSSDLKIRICEPPRPAITVPAGQKNATLTDGRISVLGGKGLFLEGAAAGPYPLTHRWDFGDGTIAAGRTVSHSYSRPGLYQVTYTVSDGQRNWTAVMDVNVKASPPHPVETTPYSSFALVGVMILLLLGSAIFLGWTEIGLGLLAPLLVFLYSRTGHNEILDNFSRGEIRGYIVANPGDHYSAIREALGMSNGKLAFHLKKLEMEGVIKSRVDGTFRRYYPAEMRVPEPNGGSLSQVQKMVFDKILETPGITQRDIAGILNISAQTVGYHVDALLAKGVVRKQRAGMRVLLFVDECGLRDKGRQVG